MIERTALIETPLGAIGVSWANGVVTGVDLEPRGSADAVGDLPVVLAEALRGYFADGARSLDLAVALRGTPFQLRVWEALREIPPGRTLTYGELAARLGTSARAVGGACRANPCPLVVPCHRVVAKQGLGGFAGDSTGHRLEVKRWLLRHEGIVSQDVPRPSKSGSKSKSGSGSKP